jgi:hypothetical protein
MLRNASLFATAAAVSVSALSAAFLAPAALRADDKKEAAKPSPTASVVLDLKSVKFKVPADASSLFGHNDDEGKLFFYSNGVAEGSVKLPADGEYEITVRASCDSAQNEKAKYKLTVGGELVGGKEQTLTEDGAKDYVLTAKLKGGDQTVAIEFTNDVYKEGEYDRNLYIHGVSFKKVK